MDESGLEQKCYVLRKTQTSVGCRTEPSRSSARFYIGALRNSAIKLAAPKGGAAFFVCAYPTSTLHWLKVKTPKAPAVKREAGEDWGR